jgi:glycosyltransferase involved in cell wall biosynthesis
MILPHDDARGGPLLTIAIPAYRGGSLLREALASLARQTDLHGVEIVVSDDGGGEETGRIVRESALRNLRFHLNPQRLGAVGNWNRCLQLARGRWVTILHEDDLLYPWFVSAIRPHLRAGTAAVAVRCVQGAQPPSLERAPAGRNRTYAPAWFLKSSMTPFPGVVFPRELGLRIGGFDAKEAGIADYAFWYALARAGRVELLGETGAFYRQHSGQWTEGEWPAMLRRAHLLRLRVAREQFPDHPAVGRWFARFYTARMAQSYERRFAQRPATLGRARRLGRIPLSWLPSGWVWKALQVSPRFSSETLLSFPPLPQSQRISPS